LGLNLGGRVKIRGIIGGRKFGKMFCKKRFQIFLLFLKNYLLKIALMRLLLFLFFMITGLMVFAQKDDKIKGSPDKLAYVDFSLRAQRIAPSDIKLPFSSIKIIDSRFDTSKIGFVPIEFYVPSPTSGLQQVISFKKIRIYGGIAQSIEDYYKVYYENSFTQNGLQLLLVMKRFWISGIDNTSGTRMDIVGNLKTSTNFYIKWEYYLGKDNNYLPVKRIDTLLKEQDVIDYTLKGEFSESRQAYFKVVLKSLIEILDFNRAVTAYESQPKKTFNEINDFNAKRNNLVILQDSIIKKGVYLSFDEFANNNPSIKDFNIKKMRYGVFKSEPYLEKPDGEMISEYWGYSDGKEMRFGKFGNELIYRKGNTFEFYVLVKLNNTSDVTAAIGGNQLYLKMPYQLDMETGLPY
jgi:hypothetical protein